MLQIIQKVVTILTQPEGGGAFKAIQSCYSISPQNADTHSAFLFFYQVKSIFPAVCTKIISSNTRESKSHYSTFDRFLGSDMCI